MKNAKREIISLALLLEEISEYAIFIDYQGHVEELFISVTKNAEEYKEKVFRKSFYTNFRYEGEKEKYEEIKNFLETEIDKHTAI